MPSVLDVAKIFLLLASKALECPDPILHMKLQRMCYYAQGCHLALYGEELFPEEFQAREEGPVCHELYEKYKVCGNGVIGQCDLDVKSNKFTKKQLDFTRDVYIVYGQFSAWRLREMIHEEAPWLDARAKGNNCVIPKEVMRVFYKSYVVSREDK